MTTQKFWGRYLLCSWAPIYMVFWLAHTIRIENHCAQMLTRFGLGSSKSFLPRTFKTLTTTQERCKFTTRCDFLNKTWALRHPAVSVFCFLLLNKCSDAITSFIPHSFNNHNNKWLEPDTQRWKPILLATTISWLVDTKLERCSSAWSQVLWRQREVQCGVTRQKVWQSE